MYGHLLLRFPFLQLYFLFGVLLCNICIEPHLPSLLSQFPPPISSCSILRVLVSQRVLFLPLLMQGVFFLPLNSGHSMLREYLLFPILSEHFSKEKTILISPYEMLLFAVKRVFSTLSFQARIHKCSRACTHTHICIHTHPNTHLHAHPLYLA